MAKVTLHRLNNAFHFEARNSANAVMHMDASTEIGDSNLGMRPLEALVASLGGCSAIDVIMILQKQRQQIDSFDMELEYERDQNMQPALITKINMKYIVKGKVDKEKLEKAIELSLDKYCTVSKMLEKTARITTSYQLN
ncbi:MAG: OsmC family protein [Bacteroidia bacterium]